MDQATSSTTRANSTLPAQTEIMNRTLQAYRQAGGPLPTSALKTRPWFQTHGVQGAVLGRAVSALVRNGHLRPAGAQGIYELGDGTPRSTTQASTTRQASSSARKPPKQMRGNGSTTGQNVNIAKVRATGQRATTNQRQQPGKQQAARQYAQRAQSNLNRSMSQARTTSQAQGNNQQLVQRMSRIEAQLKSLARVFKTWA